MACRIRNYLILDNGKAICIMEGSTKLFVMFSSDIEGVKANKFYILDNITWDDGVRVSILRPFRGFRGKRMFYIPAKVIAERFVVRPVSVWSEDWDAEVVELMRNVSECKEEEHV